MLELERYINMADDIVPVVHYSESRSKEQLDESIRPQPHSDYVIDYIDTYAHNVDIMVEASKHKELVLLTNIRSYIMYYEAQVVFVEEIPTKNGVREKKTRSSKRTFLVECDSVSVAEKPRK